LGEIVAGRKSINCKHKLLQNLLVMKLREVEETGGGATATVGSLEVAAMTQHDLISWYFDYQTAR